MKKVLTIVVVALCMFMFVGATNAGSFLAGGGASLSMFGTEGTKAETVPFTLFGYGLTTNADFGNGIIPHESYGVIQFGRAKDSLGEFIVTKKYSVVGVWHLADSTKKFQPLFLGKIAVQNEDPTAPGSTTYLDGEFGFGGAYPLSGIASAWAGATVIMGKRITSELAAGLKIKF